MGPVENWTAWNIYMCTSNTRNSNSIVALSGLFRYRDSYVVISCFLFFVFFPFPRSGLLILRLLHRYLSVALLIYYLSCSFARGAVVVYVRVCTKARLEKLIESILQLQITIIVMLIRWLVTSKDIQSITLGGEVKEEKPIYEKRISLYTRQCT